MNQFSQSRFYFGFIFALGLLLSIPSLNTGLQYDDFYHRVIMLNVLPELSSHTDASLFGLFSFMDGNPERVRFGINQGVLPWWTLPEVKYTFFRPLAEISIWLDYQLWPANIEMMHWHNSLWFAFAALSCAYFFHQMSENTYLRILPSLCFLASATHGVLISWLASRNALISVCFGLLSTSFFIRYAASGSLSHYFLSIILLLLSMAAGEIGISTCAFIASFGLVLSHSSLKQRILDVIPFVFITLLWIAFRAYLNFGAFGSGYYFDPFVDTSDFLENFFQNIALVIPALWLGIPAEILLYPPVNDIANIHLIFFIFSFFLLSIYFPFWIKNKRTWFYLGVLILCLVPISGSKVQSRVLVFACIPAFAFMIECIVAFFQQRKTYFRSGFIHQTWKFSLVVLSTLALISHLFLSPLISIKMQTLLADNLGPLLNKPAELLELPENIGQKKLILVNPPIATTMLYLPLINLLDGKAQPENTWLLSSGLEGVSIHRSAYNMLELEPEHGYLHEESERIFRSDHFPMKLNEQVKLNGMSVRVTQLNQMQRPQKAEFIFEHELEHNNYVFKVWGENNGISQFVDFSLPKIGETIFLPASTFVDESLIAQ